MTYGTLPTAAGVAELAAAQAASQTVPFTHIAIGDGNGAAVGLPTDETTGLVHEVYRAAISAISVDPDHPTWIVYEAAVPESVGGWTAREVGLIGGRVPGIVMAVGNYPVTEKTVPADGSGRAMIVRMIVAYSSTAAISFSVNPQAYATAQTVAQQIAAHEAKADPHPIYLTRAEADSFYDSIGLAADAIATDAARLSTHVAAPDPHPQYLTQPEADALYAKLGNLSTADVLKALLGARARRYFNASGM